MSSSVPEPERLAPEAAAVLSKVRRIMAISLLATAVAIALVFAAVGWRMMRLDGAPTPPDVTLMLPRNGRLVASALSGDRILLTVDVEGRTELHLLDAATLAARGRVRIANEP